MTFRLAASIDANQHKGLILLNSISGAPLVATGLSLTNAQPMHVAIVDGSGTQITTFGGGTEYTDGGTPPAHPVGGTIEWSDGANWQTVSTSKPLPVTASITPATGIVDTNNSSTATLTSGSTFTGTGTSVLGYGFITVYVYSDQSSAASGVKLEFSSDNSTWNDASLFTFTAGGSSPNDGQTYGVAPRAQYFRVVYINGGTGQGTFKLQTVLKPTNSVGDLVTMTNVPNSSNHALLTKSSIVGLTTGGGGGYVDVKVNPSGALTAENNMTQIGGTNVSVSTGASDSGTLRVQQALPGSITNGQKTVTASAAQINSSSVTLATGVTVEALSSNALSVFIGNSSVTTSGTTGGIELTPGSAVTMQVNNINLVYVIGQNTTDIVSWIGS